MRYHFAFFFCFDDFAKVYSIERLGSVSSSYHRIVPSVPRETRARYANLRRRTCTVIFCMSSRELETVVEEIPLEIEDYSCSTHFEEVVREMEQYIITEFRTRPELQQFVVRTQVQEKEGPSHSPACGGVDLILGRGFKIKRSSTRGGLEEDGRDDIVVEIHVHQTEGQQHPIVRLFAVPIFFLVRRTSTSSHCSYSESSFFLSLLVCAVSRAMNVAFSLHFDGDPLDLTSPFYYANGTVPCFVTVGDPSQLTFMGVAPPAVVSESPGGRTAAAEVVQATLRQLFVQLVVKCRFCCTAYSETPDCCKRVVDCLDVFQLHLGKQSRIRRDGFEGISVSLQRTYHLTIPRYFTMDPALPRATYSYRRHTEVVLSWSEVLDKENGNILPSVVHTTFSFGTGTAPLKGINFTFRWNKLRDAEARDDGGRASNLNPFAQEEVHTLENKVSITAVALPKEESDLNHASSKYLSEYYKAVMEYITDGGGRECWEGTVEDLDDFVDNILEHYEGLLKDYSSPIKCLNTFSKETGDSKSDIRSVYFPGSLLCRFAYVCARDVRNIECVHALWKAIVRRLKLLLDDGKYRSDSLRKLIAVIGIPPIDEIDLAMPLIVQKMQVLVICCRRMLGDEVTLPRVKQSDAEMWESENQETFTTSEAQPNEQQGTRPTGGCEHPRNDPKKQKWLITNGEILVEPQSLPVLPYTTDVLLLKGEEERDRHCASTSQHSPGLVLNEGLFNDMCLFLYVNRSHEGRVVRFPDFIQWYSPRDFVAPAKPSAASVGLGSVSEGSSGVIRVNDDDYLSERMRRHEENTWWLLWEQATPRCPEEIIEQLFVPEEQARSVISWMENDLQLDTLLVETMNANVSNALHPLLSHRHVENNKAIAAYAEQKLNDIMNTIKNLFYDDPLFREMESISTSYSMVMRRIEEIETSVCVAIAIERTLCTLDADGRMVSSSASEDDGEALKEFVAKLCSPLPHSGECNSVSPLRLCTAALRWDVWRRQCIFRRFSADEQLPATTYLRATCMAERPLNTTPCFQQMIAETDERGIFRIAFTLAEEVL